MIKRPFHQAPTARAPQPSPRQRALANWRGIDLTRLEQDHQASAQSAAGVMPQVLRNLGLERRLSETAILRAWNNLIDPNLTAHAQPTGLLRNGTLVVTVDNSAWLSEIVRYRRREILERLQLSVGRDLVQRISFRVG